MISATLSTVIFILTHKAYLDEFKTNLIILMKYGYKYILKTILFMFDPEFVHILFTRFGEIISICPCIRRMMSFFSDLSSPITQAKNRRIELSKSDRFICRV